MESSEAELALKLRSAYTKGPLPSLRDSIDPTDAARAYRVQSINTQYWLGEGRRIAGRKIGLTSKAVQAQIGVNQPDYGVLFADMAVDDGGVVNPGRLLQPKAEAEVALVMARDLDNPAAGPQDVLAAAAYALPAIEIVDSRIADWKISFAETVADNGSSGLYVLGTVPRSLAGLDLLTCGMVLEINGVHSSMGVGAACLGNPLIAAAWLARTLSNAGEHLRSGDIVLTGALGPMVTLKPGDVVRAQIGGLGSTGFVYRNQVASDS